MRLAWRPDLRPEDLWETTQKRHTVLFNALSVAPGGGMTVLLNYWGCFMAQRPTWRFIILHGPVDEDLGRGLDSSFCLLHCGERTRGLVGRTLWERRWLGKTCERLGCDSYFGPNGVYHPRVSVPQCLLVQDPSPYVLKPRDLEDSVRTALLKRRWRISVRRAACVGYTSQYMRGLVIDDARGRRERRHLIAYNGISRALRARANQPFRARRDRQPCILSVSTFAEHKNYETLIRALALLRRRPGFERYTLRLMGRNIGSDRYIRFLRSEAARLNLQQAVSLETDRPWAQISAAYDSASLFSLTSLCESFGIPVLEAMAHGAPVVAGDCCALPEVCGTATVLVPPGDPQAVAAAWSRVLGEEPAYQKMQEAGRNRCLQFSWDKTVARWIEVMEELRP